MGFFARWEEEQGREPTDAQQTSQFLIRISIIFHDLYSGDFLRELAIFGIQTLAVTTPRSVYFQKHRGLFIKN